LTSRNDRFVRAIAPLPLKLELSNVSLSLPLSQVREGDGTTAFEAACAPGHQECVKELCAAVTQHHLVRILGLSREGGREREREGWRGRREGGREGEEVSSAEEEKPEQVMSQGGGVGGEEDDQGGERGGYGGLEDGLTQEMFDGGPNRRGGGFLEQENLDWVPNRCQHRDGGVKLEGFRHWREEEEMWDGEERRIRERLAFLRFGGVCEPEARSALARALPNGYGASN
jgi:hypothetical protein